jgi:hypothetical protein
MTELQRISIANIYEAYEKNVSKYSGWGSSEFCQFITYRDNNSDNIVCGVVMIDGISDNDQPFTKIDNILVEPNGEEYLLEDLFSKTKVVNYLQKLTKFDWNG